MSGTMQTTETLYHRRRRSLKALFLMSHTAPDIENHVPVGVESPMQGQERSLEEAGLGTSHRQTVDRVGPHIAYGYTFLVERR